MDIYTLLAFFLLIAFNATFVAAEFSLARVRKTRIDHIADSFDEYSKAKIKKAKLIKLMLRNMNDYISVCQIGITVASLALGVVAESSLVKLIEPMIHQLNLNINPHSIAIVIAITVVTIIHVILGEVVPKNIAIINPEMVIFKLASFLNLLHILLKYPVKALNFCSTICLQILGIKINFEDDIHTEDELKMIINSSLDKGVLKEQEEKLMQNIFNFSDTIARNIMVPRSEIIYLNASMTVTTAIDLIENDTHSRYPVYESDHDNIIGFVNIKALLIALKNNQGTQEIKAHVLRVLKVTDGIYIMDLIQLMQKDKLSIAILIDEFGGISGMLTIEDIVEEVFGEIEDEGEVSKVSYKKISDNTYLVNGLMTIKEVNELLDSNIASKQYETIGGYIFGLFGSEPKLNDNINKSNLSFSIEKIGHNRIKQLKITKLQEKVKL